MDDAPRDPAQRREQTIRDLATSTLDVLIIGGGIVGAGVARDAAMRGLRVGLVEQHDFAFGTSSRSSRLLHGGLRYLAQGRIGLVREASVEKKVIHHIAPHLAQPLPFIFPTYTGNRDWILWQLKIGVKIYDFLCRGRNLGPSSWLRKDEVTAAVPGIERNGLKGAVRYYDGFTNDARLVLDTLRSAEKHGARLLNYCAFTDATAGQPWRCAVADRLSGRQFEIETRAVVNATGPWAETIRHSTVKLRLTKGVHVVIDRSRLPLPETVVLTEGKRILFTIPWGERTILGTTDTDYHGPLDSITTEPEDIAYILGIANRFFPKAGLTAGDVISSWAGVRPLIANANGKPSDISRSHEIRSPKPGWFDVAGGKLTTYRLMAEQAVDRIAATLGDHGRSLRVEPCRTADEPLLPESETRNVSAITPPPFEQKVVEHYCRNEWAVHLGDVMRRRASWQYYFADAPERAKQVAQWMQPILRWTDERREEELREGMH